MPESKGLQDSKHISTFGFFKYFHHILGYRIYLFLVLNFLVGLMDGFGLAMFIPLLGLATNTDTGNQSLGNLEFIPEFFESMGISLTLVSVLIIMLLLFSIKAGMAYLRDLYFVKLRLISVRKIRFKLIKHFRSLSYRGYTQSDPGQIQFAMVGETQRLVSALKNLTSTVQNLVILLTYIFLAFFANWQFALLVSAGGLITNVAYKIINNLTRKQAKILSQIGNRFNRYLIQSVQNFKYLKATNAFSTYEVNLKQSIEDFEQTQFRIGKLNAVAASLREPVIIIIISVVLVVHVKLLGGSFGGILVSLLLFYRALSYLVSMQNTWNNFLGNSAALDAIVNLTDRFIEDSEQDQEEGKFDAINSVELRNVGLQYGDATILKHINLKIDSKQTIALVGESGAGKSTLANVIGGLIDPNQGNLFVNHLSLEEKYLNEYRNKIGYIAQDPVIFDDTIYNNITFWSEKTEENIMKFNRCIQLVHLEDMIQHLNKKEDSPLGNDGILISGGQKQRISIARELYRNVDLLIMDEATSALDTETERIIKENIDSLQGKYMMVIIAHRLSTIKNADVIYLMKGGEIIHSGDYDDLYKQSSQFKRMVDLQEL